MRVALTAALSLLLAMLVPGPVGKAAAVPSYGVALAWGDNSSAQLGLGAAPSQPDTSATPLPVDLPVGTRLTQVSASSGTGGFFNNHNLAVTSDGQVLSWGTNDNGQLGYPTPCCRLGAMEPSGRPRAVVLGSAAVPAPRIVAVAAGGAHSLALTAEGRVLGWGRNDKGQLGNGSVAGTPANNGAVPAAQPVLLPPGTTVTAIAAGYDHSLAVTGPPTSPAGEPAGEVLAWGNDESGQLGDGPAVDVAGFAPLRFSPIPRRTSLPANTTVTAVAAGTSFSLAITGPPSGVGGEPAGEVLAWGINCDGDLGDGVLLDGSECTNPTFLPTPALLPPGTTVTALAAGWRHGLALTGAPAGPGGAPAGEVLAWGLNDFGQLGYVSHNGNPSLQVAEHSPTPAPVVGLPAGAVVTALSAGWRYSVALTTAGTVLEWGWNDAGELGSGTPVTTPSGPTYSPYSSVTPLAAQLPVGTTVGAIASGPSHVIALVAGATAAGPALRGDASALYLEGVTALGGGPTAQRLPDGGLGVCEAGPVGDRGFTTTAGSGAGCGSAATGTIPQLPGLSMVGTGETVATGTAVCPGACVRSTAASVSLVAGGMDVLEAVGLDSRSSSACGSAPSASSSIASLSIAGQRVATQPVGSRIVFRPPGSPGYVQLYGNPITVNPAGARVPMAIVTLNYSRQTIDPATGARLMTSSPVEVEFPGGGALQSLIVGRVFLSLARSGVQGCP